jgi:hypothetical protein
VIGCPFEEFLPLLIFTSAIFAEKRVKRRQYV